MQQEEASFEEFRALLENAVSRIEALTADDRDEWMRVLYYLILFIWHRRNPAERETLQSVVETHHRDRSRREEIESMSKTIAQQLIEEGEARGEARGELHGRQMMLLNLLQTKFGDLPAEAEDRVQTLSIAELERLAIELIEARSLNDLNL